MMSLDDVHEQGRVGWNFQYIQDVWQQVKSMEYGIAEIGPLGAH